MTACPRLTLAVSEYRDYVMAETLAVDLEEVKKEDELLGQGTSLQLPVAQEIDGKTVIISLTRMQS